MVACKTCCLLWRWQMRCLWIPPVREVEVVKTLITLMETFNVKILQSICCVLGESVPSKILTHNTSQNSLDTATHSLLLEKFLLSCNLQNEYDFQKYALVNLVHFKCIKYNLIIYTMSWTLIRSKLTRQCRYYCIDCYNYIKQDEKKFIKSIDNTHLWFSYYFHIVNDV